MLMKISYLNHLSFALDMYIYMYIITYSLKREIALMTVTAANDTRELMKSLEENLEFSTVTDSKKGILRMIERLQKNPAFRFIVTKHGKPQAVVMSYLTHEILKKLVQSVMQSWDVMTESEKRQAVLQRFRAERPTRAAQVAAVAGQEQPKTAKAALEDLQSLLESAQAE